MTMIYEDVLNEALIDEVEEYFNDAAWKYGWSSDKATGPLASRHYDARRRSKRARHYNKTPDALQARLGGSVPRDFPKPHTATDVC